MDPEDEEMDLALLEKAFAALAGPFHDRFPKARLFLESGRYAPGPSGFYVTKALDRKVSEGKVFLITAGTMHGFLRPALARLVEKYDETGHPALCEPLFSGARAFPISTLREGNPETVTITATSARRRTSSQKTSRSRALPKGTASSSAMRARMRRRFRPLPSPHWSGRRNFF